jgi:ParB family chromosome partitioning protein
MTVATHKETRPNVVTAANRVTPIDDIEPNPLNPREDITEASLRSLALSILRHGVIQPILVRQSGPKLRIVDGERRWRAAKMAGLKLVPTRVLLGADDGRSMELALVPNLQRKDLNPIERAKGYTQLQELGYTQAEIGRAIGRSQESVCNTLRLLKLPELVQQQIIDRKISAAHELALLVASGDDAQFEHVLAESLAGKPSRVIDSEQARAREAKTQRVTVPPPEAVTTTTDHQSADGRWMCPNCGYEMVRSD